MSNRSVFSSLAKLSCLLPLFVCAVSAQADDDLGDRISAAIKRVFSERKDATVRVEAYDKHGKLNGTGFFADPAGTIFTLTAVVGNAEEIYVIQGDRKLPAKLLIADPRSGVALIKVDANSPFIPIGDSHKLSTMSPVITIGYPLDLDATPSFGIIAGFDRKDVANYFVTTHIRANLPVEPGFGGAPVLNLKGEVVSIVVSDINGGGACYSLPIEAAEKIRMDYVRFGAVQQGWIGVTVEEQPTEGGPAAVKIVELQADTPAAQSGLKDGDQLLQVGTFKIEKAEDVIDASYFLTAGDNVPITVLRDGQQLDIDVKPTKHPMAETAGSSMKDLDQLVPKSSVSSVDSSTDTIKLR
ncbi:hypothetical protein BH09VER1_BH09VER1_37170 [soil metagenome]